MVFYEDHIPYLYDLAAELGYFQAHTNDKCPAEIERVRKEMEMYCQKNHISFPDYVIQLVDRVTELRKLKKRSNMKPDQRRTRSPPPTKSEKDREYYEYLDLCEDNKAREREDREKERWVTERDCVMTPIKTVNENVLFSEKDDGKINSAIAGWFQKYRESYEWPPGTGRVGSEQIIQYLQSSVHSSINDRHEQKFAISLVEIHRWKTKNRQNRSLEYGKTLDALGSEYLTEIFNFSPFESIERLSFLIRKLKVFNCNLPICSAIASFLYNRKDVPILDRFVAQLITRDFRTAIVDGETVKVLQYIKQIPFRLEYDGTNNRRLSVYTPAGFEDNLVKYINDFVPECNRIAQDLRQLKIKYQDIHGKLVDFYPVDVEMSFFSYSMKHSDYFK